MEPNPDYNPDPTSGQITPDRFKNQFPSSQSPYKSKGEEDMNFYHKRTGFPGDLGNKDLGHEIQISNIRLKDNPDPDKQERGKQARESM